MKYKEMNKLTHLGVQVWTVLFLLELFIIIIIVYFYMYTTNCKGQKHEIQTKCLIYAQIHWLMI